MPRRAARSHAASRSRASRDRTDRRQRLAAKPERAIAEQIVASGSFEVAWRSTASARSSRVMPAPSSVTRIRRRPPPSVTISMRCRAGVERVLDQLLHRARRPLDHLAGGDAVDDGLGKLANGHRATQVRQWPANLVRRARRCEGYAVLIQ